MNANFRTPLAITALTLGLLVPTASRAQDYSSAGYLAGSFYQGAEYVGDDESLATPDESGGLMGMGEEEVELFEEAGEDEEAGADEELATPDEDGELFGMGEKPPLEDEEDAGSYVDDGLRGPLPDEEAPEKQPIDCSDGACDGFKPKPKPSSISKPYPPKGPCKGKKCVSDTSSTFDGFDLGSKPQDPSGRDMIPNGSKPFGSEDGSSADAGSGSADDTTPTSIKGEPAPVEEDPFADAEKRPVTDLRDGPQ